MRRFSMTVPMVAFEVSTSGETPVTVAVSESVPNSSVKLTRAVCCTCNSTSRVAVLKPSSSLFTVYVPGGNAGKSNRPTSLLGVVRVALVALFTTVTVAPGTTPPVESFTSPVMVPSVCAKPGAQRSNHVNPTNRVRRIGKGSFREKGSALYRPSAVSPDPDADRRCDEMSRPTDRRRTKKPGARNEKRRIAAHICGSATGRLRPPVAQVKADSQPIRGWCLWEPAKSNRPERCRRRSNQLASVVSPPLSVGIEPIPDPRLGDQISRVGRIRFELLAQLSHEDAQVLGLFLRRFAPDRFEQRPRASGRGSDAAPCRRRGRTPSASAALPGPRMWTRAALEVDPEIAGLERRDLRRRRRCRRSAARTRASSSSIPNGLVT